MRSGIVHHKSDRKPCVIPTADRNTPHIGRGLDSTTTPHLSVAPLVMVIINERPVIIFEKSRVNASFNIWILQILSGFLTLVVLPVQSNLVYWESKLLCNIDVSLAIRHDLRFLSWQITMDDNKHH